MTTLNIILIIVFSIIIMAFLLLIIFKTNSTKLSLANERLCDSESELLDHLKVKLDLIINLIDCIEKKYKIESNIFNQVKSITADSLDSFKNEKKINKCFREIIQIIQDNKNIKETKAIKELIQDYNKNELNIISIRTYHNKYTLIFNNMIKKFPYNIISKIKKYKLNELIEGKELDNNTNLEV